MTSPDRIAAPVEVNIKNWPDPPAKAPIVKNTTLKTYILDSTGANGAKNYQISDYEPRRLRMVINVMDQNIALLTDPPTESPNNTASATIAPQGLLLPVNDQGRIYEFFGPDAFWINSLNATARVMVIKEYC